jgi:hypothetical protein
MAHGQATSFTDTFIGNAAGQAIPFPPGDLENYLRAFWDFRHTRKRKQLFENSIGKAYENEPKPYSRVNVAGGTDLLTLDSLTLSLSH